MPADVHDIADAVAAALGRASLTRAFTPIVSYVPSVVLKDLERNAEGVRVTVVPVGVESTRANRSQWEHAYAVEVGIQAKLASADSGEIAGLVEFSREVAAWLSGNDNARLAEYPAAVLDSVEHNPVVDYEHLKDSRVFTGVVRFTYREHR